MRSLISLSGDAPFSLWAVAASVGVKGGGGGTSNGSKGDSSGSGMGGQNSGSSSGGGSKGNSAGAGMGGGQNSGGSGGGSKGNGAGSGVGGGQNSGGGGSKGNSAGSGSAGGPGGMGGNSNSMGGGGVGGGMGGGLNSAGNRASGAGPGASANRSTTGWGFGSTTTGGSGFGGLNSPRGVGSPTSGGMASGPGGGVNGAGYRASGAGPGASANTNTTGNGFGAPTDAARRADQAQQARASEIASMSNLSREQALGTISKAEVGVKDPYNTLSGGMIAPVTGMKVKDAIAFAKTPWKGKLANVIGAYQIKDKTLKAIAKKMGLMDATMTPQVQDQLALGLLQERANKAVVNGKIDVDKFAKELSKEWASLATETGQSYYNANGVDKASVSYAKVHEIAKDLVANGVVSANKPASSITSKDVSSYQTSQPGVSHFASTYMGAKSAPANSASSAPFGGQNSPAGVNSPAQTAAVANAKQQNDPSGLPPGTYPGYDPSGLPPDEPAPSPAPAPTSRPATPAPAPAPAPTPAPRTVGQKVAAAAIDVGLGMLPGVGTAVSVINGGLALTGNETLGERAVGSFVNGKGGSGPDSGASHLGGGNNHQIIEDKKDQSTIPAQESFEDRYMKFIDATPRPTPAQKWNYDTSGYA